MSKHDPPGDNASQYALTADNIDIDDEPQERALIKQVLLAGNRYLTARWEQLIEKGVIDRQGNLLNDALPPDMAEGSGRDFGG